MTALAYYLLKVIICSGVLFLYYHLALRNKLFHQWNRFYLLVSVFISLTAPVVQVSIMHYSSEESNKAIKMLQVFESADGYLEEVTIRGHQGVSADQWLIIAYSIVSTILFFSVLLSFRKIISIIRSHTIQWIEKIKFINTNEQGAPFSFFNFVFWNEEIDLQTETGQQIFEHELVHVREKHTLDKLFIQLLLVVFWCNPFFWLIRRELQLIHEFIADKKAVGEQGTAALAAMILNSSYPTQFNSITNQFFQTSIKRRLAMLTKIQNLKINYLTRILALPILAITVLAFTLRTKSVNNSSIKLDKQITVVIDAGHGIMPGGAYNGAKVGDVYEDDINLAIAKKIQELNTNDKVKIVLTRNSDAIVELHRRVDIAKESHADLFLSLHVNSYAENADPALRSDQELKSGFGIYVSNKQPSYQQESETLGSILQQELSAIYPTNPFLLKRKVGIWVLDQNVCPSVLVECGFLTDEKDRAFITKENNQKAIAQKILEAVERYALSQQEMQENNSHTSPGDKGSGKINSVDINMQENTYTTYYKNGTKDVIAIQKAGAKNLVQLDSIPQKPLYVLNGKEFNGSLNDINANDIESINVLKDNAATSKYGEKGTNGVVEIQLKSGADPLYIVNGKEAKKESLDKIDPSTIESINVLKDKSATSKYGEKGANGVVEIQLKLNGSSSKQKPLDTLPKKEPLFTKVEIEASVNKEQWTNFLRKSLQPLIENAAARGVPVGTYTVNVKFIVHTDGSISNIETLNDPGYDLAKNVREIMKNSPRWSPGLQNGKPVNSYHTQPIVFLIADGGKGSPATK